MHSRCTFDRDEPPRRLNQFSRPPWRLRSFTIQNDSRENDRTYLSDSYIIYLNLSATIDLHDSLCHLSPVENHSIATIFLRFDRFVSSCLFRYFFPFFHQSIVADAAASNTRNARVILDIIRALPERTSPLLRNHDACTGFLWFQYASRRRWRRRKRRRDEMDVDLAWYVRSPIRYYACVIPLGAFFQ